MRAARSLGYAPATRLCARRRAAALPAHPPAGLSPCSPIRCRSSTWRWCSRPRIPRRCRILALRWLLSPRSRRHLSRARRRRCCSSRSSSPRSRSGGLAKGSLARSIDAAVRERARAGGRRASRRASPLAPAGRCWRSASPRWSASSSGRFAWRWPFPAAPCRRAGRSNPAPAGERSSHGRSARRSRWRLSTSAAALALAIAWLESDDRLGRRAGAAAVCPAAARCRRLAFLFGTQTLFSALRLDGSFLAVAWAQCAVRVSLCLACARRSLARARSALCARGGGAGDVRATRLWSA